LASAICLSSRSRFCWTSALAAAGTAGNLSATVGQLTVPAARVPVPPPDPSEAIAYPMPLASITAAAPPAINNLGARTLTMWRLPFVC
jgi:hypothetical protein